jgi:outer membrane protein OmpA-like peptidoglycan-associated protein
LEDKVVKKLFPLAILAACALALLLASCATTKSGKAAAAPAKSDKTTASTAKSDKAPAATQKSDKEIAATQKSTEKAAATAKTDTTAAATKKSDKEIAEDLAKRIKAAGLKNVDVKTTRRGVTLIAGALNFPGDSATITADTARRLDAIAKLLRGYESKKLLIQGHTADVGDKKSQQELSLKRAKAVGDYFVRKGVVKASQLVIEGKGGSVPLAKNDTDEGRAKNRRVEITLLR